MTEGGRGRRNQARARVVHCGALVTCLAGALISRPASADPQVSGGVVVGGAANGSSGDRFREGGVALGIRVDALFGRSRDSEVAVGPYVEAMTVTGFDDAQVGGGGAVLLPLEPLAIVLSAGPFERRAGGRWRPGVAGELFLGSRSLNYHSWYGLAAGLVVQGRFGLQEQGESSLVVGARVDTMLLALPVLLLWGAVR